MIERIGPACADGCTVRATRPAGAAARVAGRVAVPLDGRGDAGDYRVRPHTPGRRGVPTRSPWKILPMPRHRPLLALLGGALLLGAMRASAGPPYVTDDPEPTPTGQFENYLYVQGTHATGAARRADPGVEINYGAYADTQLSLSLPLTANPGATGMGEVWAPLGGGIKYRLIEEDPRGWRPQLAVFPQVSIPVGPDVRGASVTGLLPVWLQKSSGPWTAFGGGGWVRNPGSDQRNYQIYGAALQRELSEGLEVGVELFGQTRTAARSPGSTAAGFALLYDLSQTWHLVGSVNTALAGARGNDRCAFNLALKWTR